ncbi:MAG: PepSY domain-containing protein [Gemmatimonadetes bacterium]|nr:PepSY domain-containing protein [Gemmatimonadota bacterium]
MNARTLLAVTAFLAASAGAVSAQQPAAKTTPTAAHMAHPAPAKAVTHTRVAVKEASPGLTAQAKVGMDDARKAALAGYPNGTVVGSKLEKRAGKLVYAFRIRPSGSNRVRVVMVDANTGTVVAPAHTASRKTSSTTTHTQKKG